MSGATTASAPWKGADLLHRALARLPEELKRRTTLLLLGRRKAVNGEAPEIHTVALGYVGNPHLMAAAFSAADLFVSPSRSEAFGQMILESLSCGIPVVAFGIGPVPELVRHGETGYCATLKDPDGLARKIVKLLADPNGRSQMGREATRVAVEEFPVSLEAERYRNRYRRLLDRTDSTDMTC
jgi:glycosyltransferase involved in cell wall biosynthesis